MYSENSEELSSQTNSKKPKQAHPTRFVDYLDEPTRIKFLREGIFVGPAAFVGPGFARTRPWDIPDEIVESFTGLELRVAVRQGILTREVLTAVQLDKLDAVRDTKMQRGIAASLMGKIARTATENNPRSK